VVGVFFFTNHTIDKESSLHLKKITKARGGWKKNTRHSVTTGDA